MEPRDWRPLILLTAAVLALVLTYVLLPRATLFEFNEEQMAMRRVELLAGFRTSVEPSQSYPYFFDELPELTNDANDSTRAEWRLISSPHSRAQTSDRERGKLSAYSQVCDGLRLMCTEGSYGMANPSSGRPNSAARQLLIENTRQVLRSSGAEEANRYLVYVFGRWLDLSSGWNEAIKTQDKLPVIGSELVPTIEEFESRDKSKDYDFSYLWTCG